MNLKIIPAISISNRKILNKVKKINSRDIVHNSVNDTVIIMKRPEIKLDQNIIRRVSQKEFWSKILYL